MVDEITNCAQIREQMPDAASASLADGILAAFNAHLRGCAACAKEFFRMQTVAQAINRNLSARFSTEPSPQLVPNVQRQIIAQPCPEVWWRQRIVQLTAIGVFAALAIFIIAARSLHEFEKSPHDRVAALVSAPPALTPAVHPRLNAGIEAAPSRPLRLTLTFARHASLRASHGNDGAAPEVIVEPGQMQAILRFAAAMQRGQIDGAQFLADQKTISEPPEIKPLTVAPLKIAPLDADSAPAGSAVDSQGSVKTSVSGHSD